MAPLPPVPAVLRAQLQWDSAGDTSVTTTQYFAYSGGAPSGTEAAALANDIVSAMEAAQALWPTDVILTGVKATDLSSPTGGEGEAAADIAGTRTGQVLSNSSALLINYSINRRYRGGKPRNYLPWGVQADMVGRTAWDAGFLASATAALTTYFATVIGSSAGSATISNHVNISYYDGFTVETSPGTGRARNVPKLRTVPLVDNIASFVAASRMGSQRRRIPRA